MGVNIAGGYTVGGRYTVPLDSNIAKGDILGGDVI